MPPIRPQPTQQDNTSPFASLLGAIPDPTGLTHGAAQGLDQGLGAVGQFGATHDPTGLSRAAGAQLAHGTPNAKLAKLISACQGLKGPPYRYGGGHNGESYAQAKAQGVDCTGLFDIALPTVGVGPIGDTTTTAPHCSGQENYDPKKEYEAGTVVLNPSAGEHGHIAMIIGPGQQIIQSGGRLDGTGVNDDMKAPQIGIFTLAFTGGFNGVGTSTNIHDQGAASGAGNFLTNAVDNLAAGIGQGIVRALKYVYAYSVLVPYDFLCGFAYEWPKAIYKYLSEKGQLWDKFWLLSFFGLTYWLAFGKRQDGQNVMESFGEQLAALSGTQVDAQKRQPKRVAVEAAKVGAVRVEGERRRVRVERVGETAKEKAAKREATRQKVEEKIRKERARATAQRARAGYLEDERVRKASKAGPKQPAREGVRERPLSDAEQLAALRARGRELSQPEDYRRHRR